MLKVEEKRAAERMEARDSYICKLVQIFPLVIRSQDRRPVHGQSLPLTLSELCGSVEFDIAPESLSSLARLAWSA
jgi:hypothetical protein